MSSPQPASTSGPILEGVLAVNKPPAISSAQVIRDVQRVFNPSQVFAPWLERERRKRERENPNQRQRRKDIKKLNEVKTGHGGTLDPMATGVLILGLGSGTKELGSFLGGVKSYECVVLFGAATDTYDSEGKIVGRKAFEHVTKEKVEEAFAQFRGNILQKPPIFSALRIDGKRMYEYAREGKELPREIESRAVEVQELEMVDWMEGGRHEWHWPEREAAKEEKEVVEKVLQFNTTGTKPESVEQAGDRGGATLAPGTKRKHSDDMASGSKRVKSATEEPVPANATRTENTDIAQSPSQETTTDQEKIRSPCPAPACRIRMSVSSGFYVRSLCHDLGAVVGSLALMSSLKRTRQGEFELGKNVLEYSDLGAGEEVWGPKVKGLLEEWTEKHAVRDGEGQAMMSGKEAARRHQEKRNVEKKNRGGPGGRDKQEERRRGQYKRDRRNTSSEDD